MVGTVTKSGGNVCRGLFGNKTRRRQWEDGAYLSFKETPR